MLAKTAEGAGAENRIESPHLSRKSLIIVNGHPLDPAVSRMRFLRLRCHTRVGNRLMEPLPHQDIVMRAAMTS